jgi:hypothetical protein
MSHKDSLGPLANYADIGQPGCLEFERYLKSRSDRAFAKKRFNRGVLKASVFGSALKINVKHA